MVCRTGVRSQVALQDAVGENRALNHWEWPKRGLPNVQTSLLLVPVANLDVSVPFLHRPLSRKNGGGRGKGGNIGGPCNARTEWFGLLGRNL